MERIEREDFPARRPLASSRVLLALSSFSFPLFPREGEFELAQCFQLRDWSTLAAVRRRRHSCVRRAIARAARKVCREKEFRGVQSRSREAKLILLIPKSILDSDVGRMATLWLGFVKLARFRAFGFLDVSGCGDRRIRILYRDCGN